MLLCGASTLSSGWSLGGCADHRKGERAAGKVCCDRGDRMNPAFPPCTLPPARAVPVHACAPACSPAAHASARGSLFCQPPRSAGSRCKEAKTSDAGISNVGFGGASGSRGGSRLSRSLRYRPSNAAEVVAEHGLRAVPASWCQSSKGKWFSFGLVHNTKLAK